MGFVIFYGCFVGLSACRVCRNFFYRMRCLPSLFPYKVCFLSSGVLRKGFVAVMSPIFTIVLIQFFHRNLFLLRERHIFFYNRVYLKIPSELVLTIVVSSLPVVSIQKKCRCVLKSVILQWNKNVYHFFYAAWGPRKQQYSAPQICYIRGANDKRRIVCSLSAPDTTIFWGTAPQICCIRGANTKRRICMRGPVGSTNGIT